MDPSKRDALIGRIYDTLLEPGDWTELLEVVSEWIGSPQKATLPSVSAEIEVNGLIAHMERAVRGSSHLHTLEDQNALLDHVHQSMPWPMLMLDQEMRVVSCNPIAQKTLSDTAPLRIQADGRLSFNDNHLKQELRAVLSMVRGRQPQILTSPTDALTILCIPFGKSDAAGEVSRVRMIVWVLSSQHVVVLSPEALQSIFHISQAEGRLLHLLCKVGNLNQCATLLNVSTHTVRAQLKSTMAKIGVNSQVQLVSQAMGHSLLHTGTSTQVQTSEYTMTLSDERVLSWYEYGDAKGRPVLTLENIGSSIPDHSQFDAWYRKQKLRVIVVVRPGYGLSTAKANFQFRDLAADLKALCQHLKLERPVMAAYCCGSAYALCAAAQDNSLFERIGVLGSTVPIENFELDKLDRLHRMFLQLFRRDPRLFVLIGKLALRGVQHSPEKYFRYLAKGLSKKDRAHIDDPNILQTIIRQMRLRHFQGARMQIEEYVNLQRPWGVDLGNIRIPTLIWHGEDDAIISAGSARSMAAGIPNAEFRSLPDQGHFLVFDLWQDFITALLALPAASLKLTTAGKASAAIASE